MKVERRTKNFPSFKQGKHNFYNESNEDETLPAGQLVIFFLLPTHFLPPHSYSILVWLKNHQQLQTKKHTNRVFPQKGGFYSKKMY